jgi:5-methyltetrahydropteroyltriglutamate--homocysteine methyltransferase
MRQSTDRILTTHVGSMPRPQKLVDVLIAKDHDRLEISEAEYDAIIAEAVDAVVARQVEAGVDIPSDGEASKVSYSTYMMDRLHGFGGDIPRKPALDLAPYPELRTKLGAIMGSQEFKRSACIGEISVKSWEPLHKDIKNLVDAAKKHGVQEAFMNSASPGLISAFQPNQYYKTHEEYVWALAKVMKEEYEAIVAAGLIIQLDCPDLAMAHHTGFQDLPEAEFVKRAEMHVEAMNFALADVPADRCRMHICWGNYEGPHDHDIDVQKVMHVLMAAKPAGILFEAANARHDHEWVYWAEAKIPDYKVLIPGMLDSCSNYVEHPELIAQRVERFAGIVGKERVIAGTDCGFGTFAGYGKVDAEVAYKKLRALADGAAIATKRLWAKAA